MSISRTILSRITSFILISVFAFGITPVTVIHNLFANHKDQNIQHHHTRTSEIANAGINCHTENFVAERNFIATWSPATFTQFYSFQIYSNTYTPAFYSQHHFFAELRGPPVQL